MVELTPGLELGARFVLMRRLGRGGTAEVWLADDRARGEQVALKILDDAEGVEGTDPFAHAAWAKGSVPSAIVPVLEVLEIDGRTLVVMEYMPGGDLGQFRGGSF
jgi:serine/threonine-protein kinase